MASADDQYLPDLSQVFAGEATVFSWDRAFRSLERTKSTHDTPDLICLWQSLKSRAVLFQEVPILPPPSQKSKTEFESRTSAIHVTPSASSSYDIAQIKGDALWLSKKYELAEDEALRITLLEWESRPFSTLQAGFSDAELASIRDVFGKDNEVESNALEQILPTRSDKSLPEQSSRRWNLVTVYCREQAALIATSRKLQFMETFGGSKDFASKELFALAKNMCEHQSRDSGIKQILDTIELRLYKMANPGQNDDEDEDNDLQLGSFVAVAECQNIKLLLDVLLLRIRAPPQDPLDKECILQWFHITRESNFFTALEGISSEFSSQLLATSMIVSLAVLDVPSRIAATSNLPSGTYPSESFLDTDTVVDITHTLLTAVEMTLIPAGPVALAWALMLDHIRVSASNAKESRENEHIENSIEQGQQGSSPTDLRSSYGSLQQSNFEDVMDRLISRSSVTDPIGYLLRCATEISHAFDAMVELSDTVHQEGGFITDLKLEILQEAVIATSSGLGYTPDVLRLQFAVFAAPRTSQQEVVYHDVRDTIFEDIYFFNNVFNVAAGRFPYEAVPFLRLCRLLASANIFHEHDIHYIVHRLRNLKSFTQSAAGAFASYDTVREDENLNLVTLETNASMFGVNEKKLLTYGSETLLNAVVPATTIGEVISDSTPPVIRWQHSYSGLSLLGSWLELYHLGQLQPTLSPWESAYEVVTEIILILSSLLRSTSNRFTGSSKMIENQTAVNELLNEVSSGFQTDFDVVSCAFEIMEQELQHYRRRPSNTFDTSLLTACVQLMSNLTEARSEQFWTLFTNSSLLQSYGAGDFLYSIVAGVEVPRQEFHFLEACTRLYENTITAALIASRIRSQSSNAIIFRSVAPQAQRLQASILLSMTQSLYIAYENIPGWVFQSTSQMTSIVETLSNAFSTVLLYAYGIGTSTSRHKTSFKTSSEFLMSQFRPSTESGIGVTPIIKILLKIMQLSAAHGHLSITPLPLPTKSLLLLAHRCVRLGKMLNHEPSLLEVQLLDAVPVLVRILSVDDSATPQVSKLIVDLLPTLESSRAVSLLGHLGSKSSMCLLETLKSKQRFSDNPSVRAAIWNLFATLVGQKQQWLALVILTGSPPEKQNSPSDSTKNFAEKGRGSTVMNIGIKCLAKINDLPPQVAVAMLEFVIQAQQNWSWTATALGKEKDLLPALITYIRDTFVDTSVPLKLSYLNKIASLVTDLGTTHLHYARVTQHKDDIKTLMSLVFRIAGNASSINIGSYNSSLHANLKRNFEDKFPGLEISDLRRTQLLENEYGTDYFYDLPFATEILRNDHHWNLGSRKRNQSFAAEFQRANLNLSVTNSEIALFRAAKQFLIEHCGYFVQYGPRVGPAKPTDLYPASATYTALASVVEACLKANSEVYPTQSLFENIFQSRIDLAIALLQKLVDVNAKGFEIKGLLNQAWICARSKNASYDQALANNDLMYWRSSLKAVLLALQFHCGGVWSLPAHNHEAADMLRREITNVTPTVLEIMTIVVGEGFKTVVSAIQDQKQSSQQPDDQSGISIDDLSLILSLLNTYLRITRAPEFISEGSGRLISSGIIPACCLLYSWSHTLIKPGHDSNPVYADISLQYLCAISTLAPAAEEMGIEGVLSRLLSGRTTQQLQNVPEGAGHLDQRPHCRFLYCIWASGLLPICLNLLHTIGGPVAAEVSVFLNQFPKQLSRASSAFVPAAQSKTSGSNSITHEAARESATLALISFMLDSYRQAGASAAVDPTIIMPLKGYDEHKKALSEDIADIVNTGLRDRIVATTEQEVELLRRKEGGSIPLLEKKVLHELKDALSCLRGQEVDEDEDK